MSVLSQTNGSAVDDDMSVGGPGRADMLLLLSMTAALGSGELDGRSDGSEDIGGTNV